MSKVSAMTKMKVHEEYKDLVNTLYDLRKVRIAPKEVTTKQLIEHRRRRIEKFESAKRALKAELIMVYHLGNHKLAEELMMEEAENEVIERLNKERRNE